MDVRQRGVWPTDVNQRRTVVVVVVVAVVVVVVVAFPMRTLWGSPCVHTIVYRKMHSIG